MYCVKTEFFKAVPMSLNAYLTLINEKTSDDYEGMEGMAIYILTETNSEGPKEWVSIKDYVELYHDIDTSMSFGEAIEAARRGLLISRLDEDWINKYVFVRPPDDLPKEVILNARSLPDSFKMKEAFKMDDTDKMTFKQYLCLKDEYTVVNGWIPSMEDIFSCDWFVVDVSNHE